MLNHNPGMWALAPAIELRRVAGIPWLINILPPTEASRIDPVALAGRFPANTQQNQPPVARALSRVRGKTTSRLFAALYSDAPMGGRQLERRKPKLFMERRIGAGTVGLTLFTFSQNQSSFHSGGPAGSPTGSFSQDTSDVLMKLRFAKHT